LNVVFVANDLVSQDILGVTAEFTLERKRTNVTCATGHLLRVERCRNINVVIT